MSHLASSLYTSGTNLSRSVSSVGEHQSEAYVSPTLPKRAETFGGFDNSAPLKALNKKLQQSTFSPTGSPDTENLKPGDAKLFVSFENSIKNYCNLFFAYTYVYVHVKDELSTLDLIIK